MSSLNMSKVELEYCCGRKNQLPQSSLPEVVFSGRSNVGKSSLINKLLGRKSLARVSSSPGKTGTINFYKVDVARFVDLPGYGYAKVSFAEKKRWAELVEGFFSQSRNVKLVVQLIDMRHEPSADDMHMLEYLSDMKVPFIVVLTKCDKLNKTMYNDMFQKLKQILSDFSVREVIPTSTIKKIGIEEVLECITNSID